jgi:hypothetical protein
MRIESCWKWQNDSGDKIMAYYMHNWDWLVDENDTPYKGVCTKCNAEKNWDSTRHKWDKAMKFDKPKKSCDVK